MRLVDYNAHYDTSMLNEGTPLPGDTWAVDLQTGNEWLHILRISDVDEVGAPTAYAVMDSDANVFGMALTDIVTSGEMVA